MSERTLPSSSAPAAAPPQSPSEVGSLRPYLAALGLYLIFFLIYFSPAMLAGRLLAPGDGVVSYFPAIYRDWSLWSPNIYSGYPAIGDLQFLMWYPPRYLAPSYDILVASAYVIAAFLTFSFLYRRLGHFWSAVLGGLVYSSAGFMTAHLGHLTIIHSAAWVPLLLLAIDELSKRFTARWFAAGAGGVALSFLGGHPQIFIYGLALGGAFAAYRIVGAIRLAGWIGAVRLGTACALMVIAGLALVAIQLIPLIEFQRLSNRAAAWSYADFISFSLPFEQLPIALFPFLFGGDSVHYPGYFGQWNLTELTVYSGAGTLILAAMGVVVRRKGSDGLFWLAIALGALLVALASSTLLGKVLFRLPLVSDFRAPARAAFVLNFAIAVLAATGAARLQTRETSVRQTWLSIGLVFVVAGITLFSAKGIFDGQASSYRTDNLSFVFLSITGMQVLALCVIAGMAVGLRRWLSSRAFSCALTLVVAFDLAAFGQFYEWTLGPAQSVTQMDPAFSAIKNEIDAKHGRVLPLFPPVAPVSPFTPNLNDYFGIASAGGYGPLGPAEYTALVDLAPVQDLATPPPVNVLIAAGVSHVAYIKGPVADRTLGRCVQQAFGQTLTLKLPAPVPASAIRLSSNTGCSVDLPTGLAVLQIGVSSSDPSQSVDVQMGRDTAEWAYDRPDVAAAIKHKRATVESDFDAGGGTVGHVYRSDIVLPRPATIDIITLRFPARLGASISVKSIGIVDVGGGVTPVDLGLFTSGDAQIFGRPASLPGGVEVARFERSAGPAWLVGSTFPAAVGEAVRIVRSGLLPNGDTFDAVSMAVVSEQPGNRTSAATRGGVRVVSKSAGAWDMSVQSDGASFLVISQSWHPGWHAYVNGKKTPVIRTNAAFQGVAVPAGDSFVHLAFEPESFATGLFVSAATLLSLLAFVGWPSAIRWRRRIAEGRARVAQN